MPNPAQTCNRRRAIQAAATGAVLFSTSNTWGQGNKAEEWWNWRGPSHNNHAADGTSIPEKLSPQAIAWSIDLPGRGHSSPIVVGNSLYLATADKESGTQSILAVNRDGTSRWSQVIHRGGLPEENHRKNTEASPTLASDGQALYGTFYNKDGIQLTKLSTDGKIIWQREAGRYHPNQYKYGYAASPFIYKDRAIINADYDGSAFLSAHDLTTGKTVWKVKRPGLTSFSSPVVANIAGRDQLLLSGGEMVASYDPDTGNMLWKVDGATTMATCGTMVWDGDLVFASGGYPEAETVCIAGDGSGKVLWSNKTKCYEQSMVAADGFVYAVADNGVAYCWRGTDGNVMWRQRLGGKYSSSPLWVDGKIIVFNESGEGFMFQAIPDRFAMISQSKIADEVFASPIAVDDTLYVRAAYKLGKRQERLIAMR